MMFDEFLPRVLPWVPGCPDLVALDHIRQAAREFCARTEIWTGLSLPVLTSPGLTTYPVDLDDETERVKLLDAWLDKQQIAVVATNRGRALARRQCGGTFIYFDGPLDLAIYPAPTLSGQEIVVQMVVKPSLNASEWPDDYAEHVLDISYGAIATLSMLPKVEWTDRQQASDYRALFNDRISTVGVKVSSGYTARAPRSRSRFL